MKIVTRKQLDYINSPMSDDSSQGGVKNFLKNHFLVLFIIFSCLTVALVQGNRLLFYSDKQIKTLIITIVFFLFFAGAYLYRRFSSDHPEEITVSLLIILGVIIRCSYVLLSGLYERQHDAGAFTGMGTDFINPGHIGYIEYIYKFGRLPDINPYELFAYYHPPLHHILSFLWLKLNTILGVSEELAFENLQILPLLYSCLCTVVVYRICKLLKLHGRGLYIGMAFLIFHPASIFMAGSVNNDMLTMLFMCLTLYAGLKWIRRKNLKNLIMIGLYLAFGMLTKLNSAVIAFPLGVIFLMHFIRVIRSGTKSSILLWIRNYALFALVTGGIGLIWILRNLVRFREKPGVPVPGVTSPMYTAPYSLWERLGIPSLSAWSFDFPFHPISAKACSNTWVIMFQTSLFAEEFPADLSGFLLSLSQVTYTLAVILGLVTAALFFWVMVKRFREQDWGREDSVFFFTGYVIMLISFAAFVIIYPYTCSSDFRYVIICLVYIAIGLAYGNRYFIDEVEEMSYPSPAARTGSILMQLVNFGIIAILVSTTLICTFWNRW